LITGATGWLGRRLIRALLNERKILSGLKSRNRIRCLVLPGQKVPTLSPAEEVEIVEGDLRDPASLKVFCRKAEGATLFHCAGVIHPALFSGEFFEVNVKGTRHLLQEAEAAQIRRAIVVSSNSPAGNNPRRDHMFDEGSPYNPYMKYGRSKMLMEKVVKEFQALNGLETVIIRATWFYGPEHPRHLTTFFRMIRRGMAPIVGDGENLRSMTYIDNLCQALLLCEKVPAANGEIYWVADRRPYSMNEIIQTIESLMNHELGLTVAHRRLRLPSWASDVAWLADKLIQNMGFYHQKIHVLSEMNKNIVCNIGKAKRDLGYIPEIDLEEGMRRSLQWCQSQGIEL
jgi:nucleoside-diphosphate-sugar epimerase